MSCVFLCLICCLGKKEREGKKIPTCYGFSRFFVSDGQSDYFLQDLRPNRKRKSSDGALTRMTNWDGRLGARDGGREKLLLYYVNILLRESYQRGFPGSLNNQSYWYGIIIQQKGGRNIFSYAINLMLQLPRHWQYVWRWWRSPSTGHSSDSFGRNKVKELGVL